MEELLAYSDKMIDRVPKRFTRYLYDQINWDSRLIGLKGARGTGKTTLLLQTLSNLDVKAPKGVYLTLDDLYFTTHSLVETIQDIYQEGGTFIALDEVHKYSGWAREIKNIYDRYPDLQIIFTGSSVLDISKEEGDLSRRAVLYELNGLSYREFLHLEHGIRFAPIDLNKLLQKEMNIGDTFPEDFRPLSHFQDYLRYGFYPFFIEEKVTFEKRLQQVIRMTVEYDMAEMEGIDIRNARKILQLLGIVAQSVPFKPNISKLAQKINVHRNSLVRYLHHLEIARLVHLVYPEGQSTSTLQKPEKLLLHNPNLAWALSDKDPEKGNLRETFAISQLRTMHQINDPKRGDLLIDNEIIFEIGGRSKSNKQIAGLEHAFLVLDDIEFPAAGRIPLWLLGFLY